MSDRYIAITVLARYDGRDREAIEAAIEAALGCIDGEDDCPMIAMASTVGTLADASTWLHGPDEEVA